MARVQEPPRDGGIGRAKELATLAFARDTARTGRGGLLAICGDRGIGKTWLCEAASAAAAEEGFAVGWGAGWPTADAPRLWPWHQALRDLLGDATGPLLDGLDVEPGDRAWFNRCVGVIDALKSATVDRPGFVVIDDADRADPASLHLAQFVARHVRTLPLVVVVAFRTDAPETVLPLLKGLARDGTSMPLGGLAREEVAAILAAEQTRIPDADLDFVLRSSKGRPLDVQRLVTAATTARPATEQDGRTAMLRAVMDRRLGELNPRVRDLAARAAVLGRTMALADIAAIRDDGDPDPTEVVTALRAAGLAAPGEAGTLTFAHDEVVTALTEALAPATIVDVHARMAAALAAGPATPSRVARRAHHALEASGRSADDARAAVDCAVDAAALLVARHDNPRAADLLGRAVAVHQATGLGGPRASLLAAHAGAVLRCGHLATSRALFEVAADVAETEGDIVSLAYAALGLSGVWLGEQRSAIDQHRALALLRRAIDELPASEELLRVRLRMRQAAERAYTFGDDRDLHPAVGAARATGDASVLAEALSLLHHTMLGPAAARDRRAVADELLEVAAEAGDDLWMLMALFWQTVDKFLAGEIGADRSRRELRDRAAALGCRSIEYVADVIGVMVLTREGRLAEADERARACFEVGLEVGDPDAIAWYGGQLANLRWLEGRSADVLRLIADTGSSPTLSSSNEAFTAVYASLAADAGECDEARAALQRLWSADLRLLSESSVWLATLFAAIEAASTLGDEASCREAARYLAPYADLPVLASTAAVCLGSARRSLGLAALTCGDVDDAIKELELAVEVNERIGNRPMAAMTRADLARALLVRGGTADRADAARLLDTAIRQAEAMGMDARAAAWRERRQSIGAEERRHAAEVVTVDDVGTIRRHGTSWILAAGGREVVVPDLLGMNYLAELLTRPGREIAATDLAAGGAGTEAAWRDDQPLLDDQALAAYRARIVELEDDLAEAERFADSERAARARQELDELVDELGRATNVHGRARAFAGSAERARTAVRKAVARTLDHIEGADPALGSALRQSVRTGRTCTYLPGPGAPTRWTLAPA